MPMVDAKFTGIFQKTFHETIAIFSDSINSGEQLGVIDDTAPDIHYSHCKVYIGRDIIVRKTYQKTYH